MRYPHARVKGVDYVGPMPECNVVWGANGLAAAPADAVIVIVDVLSFTTTVGVAADRDAYVVPAPDQTTARRIAAESGAELAGPRRTTAAGGFSLSPAGMTKIPANTTVVLASPNGATLSAAAAERTVVVAAALRNATAAAAAVAAAERVVVVASGERYPDGTIRFALEDWLGAGAVAAALGNHTLTPEAGAAAAAFARYRDRLHEVLNRIESGRELVEAGYPDDVAIAAQLDVSDRVPRLHNGRYGV